ncbi:hypothetical protein [Limnoglobus roseus]|uniref:Uncharacterized protein n=1 Tax=Limnoglobus roseus TaxID=2598579 RepID=A0A5C1AM41_9BACT|nr:hypothetical protein [Limnoglobus roseus]QEL20479.1 hypothetical protein PX52LOC_07580 [Limnoglobus roseus]
MSQWNRVRRIEDGVRAAHPTAAPPGLVFVLEATADRPPGRWVRADGATVVLVYDPAGPEPDLRFPGNPLALGGIDPFACEPNAARDLRFVPTEPLRIGDARAGRLKPSSAKASARRTGQRRFGDGEGKG